jgi:ribosomal protein S18 acetylase RimI-like enzyme
MMRVMIIETIIRPADHRDLETLGRLGAELIRLHHSYDPERFLAPGADSEQGYAWFLGTQLDDSKAVVFAAERRGEVVGYVYGRLEPMSWMELRGPAGFIHDVVVSEGARRRGVATDLVEAAVARLAELGAPRVMLWTAARNTGARTFFERLGFHHTMLELTREFGEVRAREIHPAAAAPPPEDAPGSADR